MGSVFYKEDRLRESVEHYKIAVALAPQDRYATITPQSLLHVSSCLHTVVCISSAATYALSLTFVLIQAVVAFIGQHTG